MAAGGSLHPTATRNSATSLNFAVAFCHRSAAPEATAGRLTSDRPRRGHALQQPSVSVILVVRNGEEFIAEALESVLLSPRQLLEILVIDGGSTDRTPELARGFPLVTVAQQRSSGIANAYNEGIELARGELVAFISHDDLWLPGKLDRQVEYMAQHPEVLYTVTQVQYVLQPGTAIHPGFRIELFDHPMPGMIMEALVARRAVFEMVGRFDPSFPVGEDTDWFARAKDLGVAMAVLPETLVRKRVHGGNASLTHAHLNDLLLRALRASLGRKRASQDG